MAKVTNFQLLLHLYLGCKFEIFKGALIGNQVLEIFKNLELYPQLYANSLVVIYKATEKVRNLEIRSLMSNSNFKPQISNFNWEGKQQDASQETCHFIN